MIARSLRIRLLAAAAFSIGVALIVAQFGLNALFERHVVRRMAAELEVTLLQLAAGISILPDGAVEMTKELPDPRFSVPYSGFYWQIEQSGKGVILRSRSLWDGELAIPQKVEQSVRQSSLIVAGPARTKAIARLRDLVFPSASGDIPLRLVVATDTAALDVAVRDFSGDVTPSLVLLAIVLLVAAWVQVHLGLSPLEALRRGIAAIRSGDVRRLDAAFPHEVMPLVHEANALLDGQDAMITQARTRAADLAHGLKTPLTALLGDARRLRDLGQHEIAAEIDGLAQTMQRHIDHELARARIGSRVLGRGEHTLVRQNLAQVIKTLQRTPQGAAL
ncbi:MAG: hypothetical protein JNM81_10340, partial [Rhodospirillaceae bacterium]|nr:hypothetical protein [Rhodospirillaceae bacterium]